MNPAPQRVVVYGVTGSGKTAFAKRLSAATGIRWHPVDELTWEAGWTEVDAEEQRRRIERICGGERWILDSAYGKWLDVPLGRAELDCRARLPAVGIARQARPPNARARRRRRPDLQREPRDATEGLLTRVADHLALQVVQSQAPADADLGGGYERARVMRFTSPREAEAWLRQMMGESRSEFSLSRT